MPISGAGSVNMPNAQIVIYTNSIADVNQLKRQLGAEARANAVTR